jgi:Protein of unknown function (DUF1580)
MTNPMRAPESWMECRAAAQASRTNSIWRTDVLDIQTETMLRLPDAARRLPPGRDGNPTHPSTIYRWAKTGLRGTTLETIRVGGVLCTSLEALQRFCERLTVTVVASTLSATPSANRRAARRAGEVLDKLGF